MKSALRASNEEHSYSDTVSKFLTLTGELILLPKCEIHIKDKIFYDFNPFPMHGGTPKGSDVD